MGRNCGGSELLRGIALAARQVPERATVRSLAFEWIFEWVQSNFSRTRIQRPSGIIVEYSYVENFSRQLKHSNTTDYWQSCEHFLLIFLYCRCYDVRLDVTSPSLPLNSRCRIWQFDLFQTYDLLSQLHVICLFGSSKWKHDRGAASLRVHFVLQTTGLTSLILKVQ